MGNVEAAVIRNVDKRTSRREHRPTFEAAVKRFRSNPFPSPALGDGVQRQLSHSVRVCVRKRPMFPHEYEQGEFDCLTGLAGRVLVHDARMHADMKNMFMNHHDFLFDEVFDERANNDMVYAGTVQDLVKLTLAGGSATAMMYGQTGSGKTYTMSSIYERVARDLFGSGALPGGVSVSFVELFGDHTFDMLNQGNDVTLVTACDGAVHPHPCTEVEVESAQELCALIDMATKMRATAATGVHDQSSRSHAICRVFLGTGGEREGCLTLVDLAGSEHRIDSAEHNAERRKEGAKINASLCALKECVRAMANGAKFIAFRQSRLTQILRNCFDGQGRHPTIVIATVSPSSKDTEHSLNTLRHACIMDGQGEKKVKGSEHVAGGFVTKEKLGEVDITKIARERKAAAAESKAMGKALPSSEWGQAPAKPAHQAKQSNTGARSALDRRCVKALPERIREALLEARSVFGSDRQRRRLAQPPPADALPEASEDQRKRAETEDMPGAAKQLQAQRRRHTTAGAESGRQLGDDDAAAGDALVNGWLKSKGGDDTAAASDYDIAVDLFKDFCSYGRAAREWRKNDLRLIATYVVPMLFGETEAIEWRLPNVALDQLQRLVELTPPPAHFIAKASSGKPAAAPNRPPTMPPSSGYQRQRSSGAPRGGNVCESHQMQPERDAVVTPAAQPRSLRNSNQAETAAIQHSVGRRPSSGAPEGRHVPQRPPSQQDQSRPGSQRRQASVQKQGSMSDGESVKAAELPGAVAVRARREKLEEQRKKALEEALGKKMALPASREDEITDLQQQLAGGQCSAAAAVGLKKRLATLKAAAVREERKAAQQARMRQQQEPQAAAPAPAAAAPESQASPHGRRGAHGADGGYADHCHPTSNADPFGCLPEPAIPPPRRRLNSRSGYGYGGD
eukprot:TRINITY_DN15006_c0_g1_i4.p1 TRINITY_DN15006_c0_g1~~TRINITY_DN15006_c0_g1_i4.p1  ORF type:complete len:910 (-),score=161.76 TRINITY_DN15006_c0_g1_i4:216-2945(-)